MGISWRSVSEGASPRHHGHPLALVVRQEPSVAKARNDLAMIELKLLLMEAPILAARRPMGAQCSATARGVKRQRRAPPSVSQHGREMRPCASDRCHAQLGECGIGGPRMSAPGGLIQAAGPDVRAPVCLLLIVVTCTAGKSWSRTGSGGSTPPHDESRRTGRYLIPYLLRGGNCAVLA